MTSVRRMYTDRYTHTARDAANRYMLHYTHMGKKMVAGLATFTLHPFFVIMQKRAVPWIFRALLNVAFYNLNSVFTVFTKRESLCKRKLS